MEMDTRQPPPNRTTTTTITSSSTSTPATTTTTTTTSDLFICFSTNCLSKNSSSMRLTKKNPSGPSSLSVSLSRRGGRCGESPMFPSGVVGKKRGGGGAGFENNPEPSSPKVTCIGQVRVKTKKQGKKIKMMRNSRSRRHGGETSFRRKDHGHEGLIHQNSQAMHPDCLPYRNQRWVHLPMTICEALRAFGSEISCFTPCKPPCITEDSAREKVDDRMHMGQKGDNSGSCGGAVYRWFVSVNDEEEGRRRDIELVVGGDDEGEVIGTGRGGVSRRRSIFDGIEFDRDGDQPRVSICIPPKNALLLMRCRSDPVQMEALSKRLWKPSLCKEDDDGEEEEEEDDEDDEAVEEEKECVEKGESSESRHELEQRDDEADEMCRDLALAGAGVQEPKLVKDIENYAVQEPKGTEADELEYAESRDSLLGEEEGAEDDEDAKIARLIEAEIVSFVCSSHGHEDGEDLPNSIEDYDEAVDNHQCSSVIDSKRNQLEQRNEEQETGTILDHRSIEERHNKEKSWEEARGQETVTKARSEQGQTKTSEERTSEEKSQGNGSGSKEEEEKEVKLIIKQKERSENSSVLPDCLLLMMCEPKLSMEVSKETWICSTDFLRWLPERHHRRKAVKPTDASDEPKKKKVIAESNPLPPPPAASQLGFQPPRSSCSFPVVSSNVGGGGLSMASMIEQKLASAVAYEPLVLTRCKSEPMRSSAKFAHQELACFWRNRKLESHRPTAFGVGAAGIGV